jgi:hypothetical protein
VSPGKKRLSLAGGTLPSAEETPGVVTSGRHDAGPVPGRAPAGGSRTAFTWRLTAEQGITIDTMVLRLKRELGRAKLDRAEMLAALVGLADSNPAVFGALVAYLQDDSSLQRGPKLAAKLRHAFSRLHSGPKEDSGFTWRG